MKARDDQHVKGAGALKAHAQRMGQIGAVAGDHGGQHDGVVLAEAQRRGQAAHGGGQGQQARAGGVLQSADAAGEKVARRSGPGRSTRSMLTVAVEVMPWSSR